MIDDNKINLIIDIMDSGKGIKEEDKEKLFCEYVQIDMEKNKGIEGTGLGLAIAQNIVKAMSGDISLYSEYNKGSIFTIKLPQKIRSNKFLAYVENPEEISVIVYEHRDIYANSLVYTIDNLGIRCTLVCNDSDLAERMSNNTYSFIFISFELYKKNKDAISKLNPNSQIVVLAEFGETVPDNNLNILAMPVHCVPVADILNRISRTFSYNENNELSAGFTAPGANVLVVDDIITNLKVTKGLLAPYNMQVDLCKSGMTAIEAVKTNRYDIIFMDHLMPEIDGIETTKRIRALGEDDTFFTKIPIIALTANAVIGTKEMFLENGFNDFLSKPIDTVKLNSILEKWIPREKKQV
jgi:CheY-like chemotaxis protein